MTNQLSDIKSETINKAFEFGLEFGPNWLQPINERLSEIDPDLSPYTLEYLDKHVNDIRDFSVKLVTDLLKNINNEKEAFAKLDNQSDKILASIKQKSPLLSDEVLSQIYSQAIYYSRK